MSATLDDSHDPALQSWVESANDPATEFPIQNLPFGRFRSKGASGPLRIGVAIGDQVLDLAAAGLIDTDDMNALMAASPDDRRRLRRSISTFLRGSDADQKARACLVPQAEVEMGLPCHIGDYTDFYTSIHHATTVGKQFRPDNPLLPNYKWVPIGYHGRASSIGVSGESFPRPNGQIKAADADVPSVGPTRRLDYELEIGVFIGTPNAARRGGDHGRCRVACLRHGPLQRLDRPGHPAVGVPAAGPVPVEELRQHAVALDRHAGGAGTVPQRLSRGRKATPGRCPIWNPTPTTRPARSTSSSRSGCRRRRCERRAGGRTLGEHRTSTTPTGRLRRWSRITPSTAAISRPATCSVPARCPGPDAEQAGSLLELSQGGKKPIQLANGETRTFLEDGDSIIFRGYCEREGSTPHRLRRMPRHRSAGAQSSLS